jgi:hypothetical protein
MQSTHDTPVEVEMKNIFKAFHKFGDALANDVKKSWDEDIEPNLVKLDLAAESVTERTYRVAVDTLRDVFHRHPKKSKPAEA